jgi:C4-dicarboxylate-specific signal transduction histidine kinase
VGIAKSQNDNLGLGLACSKSIANKMGGDIKLKMSKKGISVFAFKIPVKLQSL